MGYLQGPAGPGENAQQVAPINIPIYDNTIWDGVTLTEEQAAQVLAGQWYVNVMTLQYPARGDPRPDPAAQEVAAISRTCSSSRSTW